jgi:hypothetical protein
MNRQGIDRKREGRELNAITQRAPQRVFETKNETRVLDPRYDTINDIR